MNWALARRVRARGQAMVEFIVIASVLLLLIMGTIQFAMICQAKITLNYAAFETARAGSLNSARMWAMELAFARASAPTALEPENFGPAAAGSFAAACTATREPPRYGVPIYAQAVMRMQAEPVRDAFCSGQCTVDSGWPRDEISP